ncbi:MAG: lipid IV(A) 3-deoxy-D-manno-octulosonic acid transferase [Gammaproteobacteria bacterium]
MRHIYTIIFYLISPYIFLRLWWKGRKTPGYRQNWAERLGYAPELPSCIWLHAVSVGELLAAKPIVMALQKHYPQTPIVLTGMTATGRALAQPLCNQMVHYTYVPYDFPSAVRRFLQRSKPHLAIIMETELWPNLIYETAAQRIPIVIANACLSEKSFRGYQKIPAIVKPMMDAISLIGAQTAIDRERFIQIGANPDKTLVWGSIKFEVIVPQALVTAGREARQAWSQPRPVVIAASTHAPEEKIALQAFQILRKNFPDALLIVVPRHPQRFDEVAELCRKQGFKTLRRSEQKTCTPDVDIFLGDSLGEMFFFYAMADVVFLGGSLLPLGGHNLLEPAALGLALTTGNQIFNIEEVVDLLKAQQALRVVANETELAQAWNELLTNPDLREAMGRGASAVVEKNRGALEKHMAGIAKFV